MTTFLSEVHAVQYCNLSKLLHTTSEFSETNTHLYQTEHRWELRCNSSLDDGFCFPWEMTSHCWSWQLSCFSVLNLYIFLSNTQSRRPPKRLQSQLTSANEQLLKQLTFSVIRENKWSIILDWVWPTYLINPVVHPRALKKNGESPLNLTRCDLVWVKDLENWESVKLFTLVL